MSVKSQKPSGPAERFVIECGRSHARRATKHYFDTFPQAEAFAFDYFRIRGVVLGIDKVKRKTRRQRG